MQLIGISSKMSKGQRRRVAIIFADISGFTPLSENLDPEEVKDLIDNCLQRLAKVIYKYEGYIDKFIGDCIMALFGAPAVHEDDPLRAVISSIELIKEINKFNKENGLNLALSIGVNYGMVATGDLGRPGEYTVMGDVVNLAQRLQSAAPRGRIYVSEFVYEQTKDEVVYKNFKQISVKGIKEKVRVYEPNKVKQAYSIRKIKELPLIGRRYELNELLDFFTEVKSGRSKVISIVGEAGIGKSKLIYEFKKKLSGDMHILEGKGLEYLKTSSYLVLRQILKNVFGIEEDDPQKIATTKLEDFVGKIRDPSVLKIEPFLKYFLSLELSRDDINRLESMKPKDRMRLINEVILSLFARISRIKPLLIIFEDCHWVDPETISFMHSLAKEIANKPVMLINLYRPEFNMGKTARLSYFSQINLEPLASSDTDSMLCDLLHCEQIEGRLSKLIMQKSAGIPFYVHELVSNLLNSNIIYIEDKTAKLKQDMESAVPRTLDELVMARIDKLDSELREVVDIASVIGDEFSIKLLDELLRQGEKLRAELGILVKQDILQSVLDKIRTPASRGYYCFKHSIMRDAVYHSILKKQCKKYHQKIGFAIEKIYGNNLTEYYDALANHFVNGGEKEKAIEYLEKAGDRKKELYLNQEAIALYHQGIDLVDKTETIKIAKLYEKLGDIYVLIGDYYKATNAYTEMGRYGIGDPLLKAKSLSGLARVASRQSLFDQAISLLDKSRNVLTRTKKLSPPSIKMALANILTQECWIYCIKGKIAEAEKKGLESVAIIRNEKDWADYDNLKRSLADAYTNLTIVLSLKGEYDRAIDLCEDTLMIAEELGYRQAIGSVYNTLGTIYKEQSRYEQAIDSYTKKLKISEELGDKSGTGIAYCNLGTVYQNRGEFEKAVALFEKYSKISEELGDKHSVGQALVNIGIAYWKEGKYDWAIKLFKDCLKISKRLGDKRGIAIASGNLGEVYESQHKYKNAIELFKRCLNISKELSDKRCIGEASYNLGMVYTETGSLKQAEEYLHLAQDIFEEIGDEMAIGDIYNSLSNLKLKQNKFDDALKIAKTAFELAKETNSTETKIKSLVSLGKIYHSKSHISPHKKVPALLKRTKDNFTKAILLAQNLRNKGILADTYYEYANLFKAGNKAEKKIALKEYRKALTIYKELNLKYRIKEIMGFLENIC